MSWNTGEQICTTQWKAIGAFAFDVGEFQYSNTISLEQWLVLSALLYRYGYFAQNDYFNIGFPAIQF